MALAFAFANQWFSSTYETLIGLFSIYKFMNSRQPAELRGYFTRRSVAVLLYVILLSVIAKDFGFIMWAVILFISEPFPLEILGQLNFYYYISYISFQMLLFIGMMSQFSMKTDAGNSHSDNQIARQTKIIGTIKIVSSTLNFCDT